MVCPSTRAVTPHRSVSQASPHHSVSQSSPHPNQYHPLISLAVWTLFDYGGEPGPWPLVSSSFGQFDLAGFAKSASHWYRANWLAAVPPSDAGRPPVPHADVVRISQSWSPPPATPPWAPMPPGVRCDYDLFERLCPMEPWPVPWDDQHACMACANGHQKQLVDAGCKGQNVWPNYCAGLGPNFANATRPLDVQVFTNAPKVELLLNGRSLGVSPAPPLGFAEFPNITFSRGNLTAVGLSAKGAAMASHSILAAGAPMAIVLSVDCPSAGTGTGDMLLADGHDAALVRATIVDAAGRTVSEGAPLVTFSVQSGPGRIAGVHNGDAKSHEPQAANSRRAYHGLARAVVRVTADALSPLLLDIDVDHGDGVTTVSLADPKAPPQDIVVTASAPGLRSGTVRIAVSADAERDSPLAAARRHVHSPMEFL